MSKYFSNGEGTIDRGHLSQAVNKAQEVFTKRHGAGRMRRYSGDEDDENTGFGING